MQRRSFIAIISAAFPLRERGRPARISGQILTNPISTNPALPTNSIPAHLAEWLRIPQQPILSPDEVAPEDEEKASLLLHHIHIGTPLTITYHGGTTPGQTRTLIPVLLFQKIDNPYALTDQPHPFLNRVRPKPFTRPPTYLLAHCHLRRTTRTFRLNRIQLT